MSTPPFSPHTWADEETPNFRGMEDNLAEVIGFLMNPPMVRLRKTVTQSIPNNVNTAVTFNFVEVETVNMWDAAAPTRIKPTVAGWYVGTYGGSFQSNTTGVRQIDILKNGITTTTTMRVKFDGYSSGPSVDRGITFIEQFNGTTDYIEVFIFQNSGIALSIDVTAIEQQPDVVLRFLAPL
jgi:hypothetical protein